MSDSFIYKIKTYLLVGKLLHIIAVTELILIILIIPKLYNIETQQGLFLTGLRYFAIIYLASLPFFSQLDARSRFQNYKQIKDQFFQYGFDKRILSPVLKSRCQRDAAVISATELGYKNECINHFKTHGYRWYHIIPDFFWSHPHFLLSKYFWRTTFFVPYYQSKIDYSSIQRNNSHIYYPIPSIDA